MAIKIAITNEKGGCGKTTTSVNLSSMLAERGYKTLLIDADPQSYTSHYFDMYNKNQYSLTNIMKMSCTAEKAVCNTSFFDLKIIPCDTELRTIEENLIQMKMNNQPYCLIMKKQLAQLDKFYDYIIIDCPPQGYKLQENIEAYVDYLLIPMIPDEYTLHSLYVKAEIFANAKRNLNPKLSILGAVIVMDEKRDSTKQAYKEALFSQNIFPMFNQTIRKNTALSRAINAHEPINVFAKRSNGNIEYQSLTDELLRRLSK